MVKSMLSVERSTKVVKSICTEIAYWYGKMAHAQVWTFERTLDWKNRNIFDNEAYKRLPRWAVSEIDGFWKAYDGQHERKLVWTHVLDGKRVECHCPSVEGRHIEINQQPEILSEFAYAVLLGESPSCRVVYLPHRQEARQKDIDAGRLSQADIDAILSNGTDLEYLVLGPNNIMIPVSPKP